MKRMSRIALFLMAACTLGGCATSQISRASSSDRRSGDALGYAIFGQGGQSQYAKVDRDR